MPNSDDKSPKSNVLGLEPMQRLSSFKTPRDLSLGGIKPNKKIFTPNLNVVRNKKKGPAPVNSQDKKNDKGRRDRRNNKHTTKNGPSVIKSSGVFSEGLGSVERHSARVSYGADVDGVSRLQKPTIRVKDVIKIDKELDEQKIKSVYGSIGENAEEEDFKQLSDMEAPVSLPMDDWKGNWVSKASGTMQPKQEFEVKTEPKEYFECTTEDVNPALDVKKDVHEDTDVVNVLKSDQPTLILLQLPDALPGRGPSEDSDKRSGDPEPPVFKKCRLADLEEGKIGKLRIHQSGRVTLALGNTIFEVSSGTKPAFYQEAVSVSVDAESRAANVVSLGAIHHKLNLVPDWENMFHHMQV
ncbi:hypothetical protein ACJJTC_000200 [Scirpophaga incertulas]